MFDVYAVKPEWLDRAVAPYLAYSVLDRPGGYVIHQIWGTYLGAFRGATKADAIALASRT